MFSFKYRRFYTIITISLCVSILVTSVGPVHAWASSGQGRPRPVEGGVVASMPAQPDPSALDVTDWLTEMGVPALAGQPEVGFADMAAVESTVLDQRQPSAVANPLGLSRVQSANTVGETVTGTLVITFTVTNNLSPAVPPPTCETCTVTETLELLRSYDALSDPHTIHDVILADSLTDNAVFINSAPLIDRDAQSLVWNLGPIPPRGSDAGGRT